MVSKSISKNSKKNKCKTKPKSINANEHVSFVEPIENEINDKSDNMSHLLSFIPSDLHLNDNFTLKENEAWVDDENNNKTNETNEIDKFVYSFALFQSENNIGMINDSMNPDDWIEVDSFIFKYLYKLVCDNKIKTIICNYGISNGFVRLFNFYREDLCIGFLQEDSDILDYISKQSDSSINIDIVLAILRGSIGFTSMNFVRWYK